MGVMKEPRYLAEGRMGRGVSRASGLAGVWKKGAQYGQSHVVVGLGVVEVERETGMAE